MGFWKDLGEGIADGFGSIANQLDRIFTGSASNDKEAEKNLEKAVDKTEENKENNKGKYDPFEAPAEVLTGLTINKDTILGGLLVILIVIGLIKN
jgi:hypothetical protein